MKRPLRNVMRMMVLACLAGVPGCVAPATPVTTVWQKLGIPQTGARLRDATLNRRGNFPGLEKKPPLLKLADPANMAPDKPAMIQTAAKIKAEQDMKKQKIKALKFLADVNCGCYNKDQAVEKAFIAALEDCDPDVRMAAVEAIDKTISSCAQCRESCETTCCTEDLYKKLTDIAYGMKDGCYKEPVQEIRCAAAAVTKKCGCFKPNPIEELPAPEVDEPEELVPPAEAKPLPEGDDPKPEKVNPKAEGDEEKAVRRSQAQPKLDGEIGSALELSSKETIHFSDGEFDYGVYENPEVVVAEPARLKKPEPTKTDVRKVSAEKPQAAKTTMTAEQAERITNPERLITAKVVEYRGTLGELLLDLPDAYQLGTGWTMVVVDPAGHQSFARISECGGRRVLLALDDLSALSVPKNKQLKIGLVER